ncbi:helix-turn-helix domain-containing protein [Paracandidimonas soli]|uniref:helix-turn-helix domain-containing protein n=1 Tax=Paracandidimonas soli TaxID=1917182 RepID=UPI0033425A8C
MSYPFEHISDRLREARIAKNLSQRELSKLAGVPQAHISRIESNQVDLRLSSLAAISNALSLEVMLVPRKAMPAVRSIVRQTGPVPSRETPGEARPAYTLDEEDQ